MNRRMLRRLLLPLAAILACSATAPVASTCLAGEAPALQKSQADPPVDQLITWLLNEDRQLRGIPFAEVISDTTGKRVLPVNPKDQIDQRVIRQISAACDETIKRFNTPDSVIQNVARVNEASSHFEDGLRQLLNAAAGLNCDFPRTAEGRVQSSGYPDLRVVDLTSKRVFYLDPKLYVSGSRDSSFRAFYFEPKIATNKVRDDAVHSVVGLDMSHGRKTAHGNSRAGTWSISSSPR